MLTDDWRVYTRIAQVYKPSGFNIVPSPRLDAKPFIAEQSINYEIGTGYPSSSVQLQAATFHTHIRDMQLYSGPVGMQTLSNAGTSDASGMEFEAKWLFAPEVGHGIRTAMWYVPNLLIAARCIAEPGTLCTTLPYWKQSERSD